MIWQTCAICGKRKHEGNGWWYSPEYLNTLSVTYAKLFSTSEGLLFACNRCVKRLEKEKAEKDNPYLKIAAEIKREQPTVIKTVYQHYSPTLKKVLQVMCQKDGWYRIKDITDNLNKQGYDLNGRTTTLILKEFGFVERKRSTNGYVYAFIKVEKINVI